MSATLRVDLDAFARNLAVVRSRTAPAELMLVVKDDAYGHGLLPIVRRARAEGVGWFGAFDVRTGLAVREALGEDVRIFVWIAASDSDVSAALDARLDVGVGDEELLERIAGLARPGATPARVHLKVDTGLHRNGVRPERWQPFVRRAAVLQTVGTVEVAGVWTHIAEASDAEDDAARAAFEAALTTVEAAGISPALRHLAASAAAFARPEFRYDLVRVGAFCYGIRSAGGPVERDLGLEPIASLAAPVVSVEADGVRVGVGSRDGVFSTLAERMTVRTPAGESSVRRIGFEESLVEPWPDAAPGDEVIVWGAGAPASATDLAERIGTIGEEVMTRLSPGIPREYRATNVGGSGVRPVR